MGPEVSLHVDFWKIGLEFKLNMAKGLIFASFYSSTVIRGVLYFVYYVILHSRKRKSLIVLCLRLYCLLFILKLIAYVLDSSCEK